MKRLTKILAFGLAFLMVSLLFSDIHMVTANAESKKSVDAKDAYYKFLSKKKIPWNYTWYGDKYLTEIDTKGCKFDTGDINNDGIPELYVFAYYSQCCMGRIFTYKNGKVVPYKIGGEEFVIGNISEYNDKQHSHPAYYKGKNIIVFKGYHAGQFIEYYSTKGKKMKPFAEFYDSWQEGMDRRHDQCISYYVDGKKTTEANYNKRIKERIGNAKKVTFSPKSNSTKNRQKYLYRYGVIPKLNKTSVTIKKGKTYTLKVSGEDIRSIKWSSSNKNAAKVSSKGKVTAVGKNKAKSATITCTVKTKKHTFKLYSKIKVK